MCGMCRFLGWMKTRQTNQATHLIVGLDATCSVELKGALQEDRRPIHPAAQHSRHHLSLTCSTQKIFERFKYFELLEGLRLGTEPHCSSVRTMNCSVDTGVKQADL